MLEGKGRCETELYKEIVRLLDPIVINGEAGTPNPTSTPIGTPIPTGAPSSSNDIDKCITDAIALLDNFITQGVFSYLKTDSENPKAQSFKEVNKEIDEYINEEILASIKPYTSEPWNVRDLLDDTINLFTGDVNTYYFKPGSRSNRAPLIIPSYTKSISVYTMYDYEYYEQWSQYESFLRLSNIKYSYMKQIILSATKENLAFLQKKTGVNKTDSIMLVINEFEQDVNHIDKAYQDSYTQAESIYQEERKTTKSSTIPWIYVYKPGSAPINPNSSHIIQQVSEIPANTADISQVLSNLKQCINN